MNAYIRHADGTLTIAEPLDYRPGVDWEISRDGDRLKAEGYEKADLAAVIHARTQFGLYLRIMWHQFRWHIKQGQ